VSLAQRRQREEPDGQLLTTSLQEWCGWRGDLGKIIDVVVLRRAAREMEVQLWNLRVRVLNHMTSD